MFPLLWFLISLLIVCVSFHSKSPSAMELTLKESVKDAASRLVVNPFSSLVEVATYYTLTEPDWPRFTALCYHAADDGVDDLVQAVRRRLSNTNSRVQYFTILLLQHLIRGCGPRMHLAIAEQKPLQKELVGIAIRQPQSADDIKAKRAALQLIINCDQWFKAAADVSHSKMKPLAEMAGYVRNVDHRAFDGFTVDPLKDDTPAVYATKCRVVYLPVQSPQHQLPLQNVSVNVVPTPQCQQVPQVNTGEHAPPATSTVNTEASADSGATVAAPLLAQTFSLRSSLRASRGYGTATS